jgi:hypothetical protein
VVQLEKKRNPIMNFRHGPLVRHLDIYACTVLRSAAYSTDYVTVRVMERGGVHGSFVRRRGLLEKHAFHPLPGTNIGTALMASVLHEEIVRFVC